jgi:uncharacterized protein (TIGR00251 family)
MVIHVKVIPGAKRNIVKKELNYLKVYVIAPAVEGKANKALIELLAQYFQTSKGDVSIIRGLNSQHKIVDIKRSGGMK